MHGSFQSTGMYDMYPDYSQPTTSEAPQATTDEQTETFPHTWYSSRGEGGLGHYDYPVYKETTQPRDRTAASAQAGKSVESSGLVEVTPVAAK